MKIFAIIVILEVAWCIPTLCFLMCRKMRRNKKNNVFVYVEKDSGKNYKRNQNNIISRSESPQLTPKQSCFNETETSNKDITAKHRREVHTQSTTRTQGIDLRCHRLSKSCNIKARHSIIATKPCPGAGTNYNISQMCSYIDKTVYERPIHPRHSSYTKCSANAVDTHKSSTSQEGNSGVPYKNSLRIANSLTMTPEQTKTVTLLKERHKTNEIIEIEKHDAESQKTTETNSVATDATKTACRCSHSRDCTKKIRYIVKSVKNTPAPVPVTQPAPKTALLKPPNVIGDTKSRGVRLSTGDPYLEITIDKPQRKVSVDYSEIQAQPIIPKRSKIPKRAVRSKEAQTVKVATKNRSISFPKRQSYIPQPKRQKTEDDIIIKNKKTSTGRDAFNITM